MKIDARLLIRLYPRRWRERYGDELVSLLEDSRLSGPRVALDVARGAVREQLRAAFVEASPRRRQLALMWLLNLGSWAIGALAAALMALALPDMGKGGTLRSILFVIGLVGTVGAFFYASVLKDNAPEGLAPGVPPFTRGLACVAVVMALGTAVIADLTLAHAFRAGLATFNDLIIGSAGRSIAFGPIGVGVFGLFWPDALRDLTPAPPSSTSTLGLGA